MVLAPGRWVLTAALGLLAASPGLADLAHRKALESLTLVGPALPAERRSLRIGHLELDLAGGEVFPVRAGPTVVGIFFHGRGRFVYRSEDRYEASHFPLNVRRMTRLRVEDGAVHADLDAALVLDSRLAGLFPGDAFTAEGVTATTQDAFRAHRRRFAEDRGLALLNRLAQALSEEPVPPVVAAQMTMGRDDLVYLYDSLRRFDEALFALDRYPSGTALYGKRYPVALSSQPLSGDRLASLPVRYVMTRVDLEVTNRAVQQLELTARETFLVRAPLRTLDLDLLAQRTYLTEAYDYRLTSVTLADGAPVAFSHTADDDLVVQLPRRYDAGESVELVFRMAGDVLYRPGSHAFWWLHFDPWFPHPSRWDLARFTAHVVVKVAKPYVPFASGRLVRRWEEGDLACVEHELELPVQWLVVLAGKYHTHTEERNGRQIHLASYAFSYNKPMEHIANNIFELIGFYEPLLGEFPFDELTVIEINDYGFGVAPPGVIYLTREAFDPGPEGRLYREELNLRMAHEVAHMWWGHVAQMAGPEEQWLSESTAEYYAALAVGRLLGEHKSRAAENAWREQRGLLDEESRSVFLANQLAGESRFQERFGLLYARGPLMLADLREELGDQTFFTVMKSFLKNFPFQSIETGKFIELTNFIAKRDLRPWFDRELFALETARP